MRKELKYGGYSASPDDHETLEGDLAVAMNLIPEDNTIKPVLPPSEVFNIPQGKRLLSIHVSASFDGKHYILQDEQGSMALYWWDGDILSTITTLLPAVSHIEPVGNTLIALTDEGLRYFLWNGTTYTDLGSNLPEVDMSFSLASGYVSAVSDDMPNAEWLDYIENNTELTPELRTRFNDMLHGLIGKTVAEQVTGKGKFNQPFFVRYALRLYDGSLTMHSAPVLMLPDGITTRVRWKTDNTANVIYLTSGADTLEYASHAVGYQATLWKDIIIGVDVFISAPIYTYNQAKVLHRIKNNAYEIKHVSGSATFGYQPSPVGVQNLNGMAIPQHDFEEWQQAVRDCQNFYLLKSFKLEDFATGNDRTAITVNDDYLPSLVAREAMTDDYHSHDTIIAKSAFSYNGRINLANVIRKLYKGANPFSAFGYSNNGDEAQAEITVEIVTDGKTVIVNRKSMTDYNRQDLIMNINHDAVVYYYYPDPNAKKAYLRLGEQCFEMPLHSHVGLNGAFFFNLDGPASISASAIPAAIGDNTVSQHNKIYTSTVNNPFYFPLESINTVGTGDILGITAATKALSQGQFGQFPLYAFTSEGIWALETNEQGGYSSVKPVSRDICINPDSITQMDSAVLFATARGIMLLSGSTVQCISDAIDDKGAFVPGMMGYIDHLAGLNGLGVIYVRPFRVFLPDCRMLYDYRGQRIIVYNPSVAGSSVPSGSAVGFPYAYIYSLQSNKWGMMQSNISYTVRSYPEALAVTHDGHLVNYSEPVEVVQGTALYGSQILVTRPLTLDQPDVLKTVNTVLQRGLFRKHQQHVLSVLFGSRDLFNWHLVSSSTDEALRGRRGTPYKWFRIALLLRLPAGESVTGCSIDFNPRYTNRLR